jgi:radical SAM protein with 4Fe4S-binding SPASM domain
MPFYMMVLNPDGSIVPCCSTQVPMIFGNVKEESLTDIWESEIRTLCLRRQLHGVERIPICRECSVPAFGLQPGDYLDGHEEELLEVY